MPPRENPDYTSTRRREGDQVTRWPGVAGLVERLTGRESFQPCLTICRKIVKQEPVDLTAA